MLTTEQRSEDSAMKTPSYQINTRRGAIAASRRRALSTAARIIARAHSQASGIKDAERTIFCPKGQKTRFFADAKRAAKARARVNVLALSQRLDTYLLAIGADEIDVRQLTRPAGWDDFRKTVVRDQAHPGLWVIAGGGWYEYSRSFGRRYRQAAYLCGRDDGQLFAVRVPGATASVADALDWLKPAAIREAEAKGLPVKRQGDIFFRPIRISAHDMAALSGTRHEARPRADGGLTIVHPQHRPIVLGSKHAWRAYASTQIHSNGRTSAD